jgi:superfamily II DNA or RNA helicase
MKNPIELYDHQKEAFYACKTNKLGKILMPTGTGKTVVAAAVIADHIIENPGFSAHLINAPRIMLSYQLLAETFKFMHNTSIEAEYMMIHSGDDPSIDELEIIRNSSKSGFNFSLVKSTTKSSDILEKLDSCKKRNVPVIFVSTYHSSDRLFDSINNRKCKLSVMINDESQYLVEQRFFDIASRPAERKYFFTATEKTTKNSEGRGMNNESIYGKAIYTLTPREAIDRGLMLRPRMHFVTSLSGMKDFSTESITDSLGKIVTESFYQHTYALNGVAPKMLIAANGTNDIKKLIDSSLIARAIATGVNVYAVASNVEVENWINGERVTRQEFLNRLKEDGADKNSRMIIIHYDILSEGIDVPGITGVMFLRGMGQSKFMQTLGRAARLIGLDRKAIHEDGTIDPKNADSIKNMIKPYAWVIVPVLSTDNEEDAMHIVELIERLRSYDFNPSEDVITSDRKNGIPTKDGLDAFNELKRSVPAAAQILDEIIAQIEDEEMAARLTKASATDLVAALFS